jgi:ParB-like chromosome segregation protein Spo0J
MRVAIDRIVVGERRREDFGDVEALAESIRSHGLLHPIVVDGALNHVAGERRLRAVRALGWTDTEVTFIGSLSEAERRAIELEENLRRKDLTAWERSKELTTLVEAVREQARDDVVDSRAKSAGESRRGGQERPDSYRAVAERTGIAETTIRRAEQHVAAVARYPETKPLEQDQALAVARRLDALPEPERAIARPALERLAATPKPAPAAVRAVLDEIETAPSLAVARLRERYSRAEATARGTWLDLDPTAVP